MTDSKDYWDGIWRAGLDVGERWDVGQPEPDFVYELSQNPTGPLAASVNKKKKVHALVPGCGRGYAAKAAADAGYEHVLAIDISPSAVEAAAAAATAEQQDDKVEFRVADFFTLQPPPQSSGFDLVLDSTFLCAIPPELRDGGAWALQMQHLIAVGGALMIHVFPIPDNDVEGQQEQQPDTEGPPYLTSLDYVRSLLLPGKAFREVLARETPPERSVRRSRHIRGKVVKEALMIWERV